MEANSQSILDSIFVLSDKDNADSRIQKQICCKMIFAFAGDFILLISTQWQVGVKSRLERSREQSQSILESIFVFSDKNNADS